jgi:hypothetical protein
VIGKQQTARNRNCQSLTSRKGIFLELFSDQLHVTGTRTCGTKPSGFQHGPGKLRGEAVRPLPPESALTLCVVGWLLRVVGWEWQGGFRVLLLHSLHKHFACWEHLCTRCSGPHYTLRFTWAVGAFIPLCRWRTQAVEGLLLSSRHRMPTPVTATQHSLFQYYLEFKFT